MYIYIYIYIYILLNKKTHNFFMFFYLIFIPANLGFGL